METLLQDLRFGFRTLVHRPAFTIVAALTLALGIGANTAIFSVVNGVLLRSLPYQDPDRIVMLWETSSTNKTIHASHLNLVDWREQNRTLEMMSGYTGRWGGQSTITGGREPERAYAVSVYRDFFNVFGVQPVVGRTFLPEESQLGSNPVAVISYGFWKRQFGGAGIDNKKLTVDGLTCNVVGVMPAGFNIPTDTVVW